MPDRVRDMTVKDCKAAEFKDCDVVFSGLDAEVAGEIGMVGPSHCLLPIEDNSIPCRHISLPKQLTYYRALQKWSLSKTISSSFPIPKTIEGTLLPP